MKLFNKNFGFTIAEIMIAMSLLVFISALLLPVLISENKEKILMTSLEKNQIFMDEIVKSAQLLQSQGRLSPGPIDADKFMQTIALTSKCIGLDSNGNILQNNNKFSQY